MKSICLFLFVLFCFSIVNLYAYCFCDDKRYCEETEGDQQLEDSLFKAAEFDDWETVEKIPYCNRALLQRMRNGLTLLHIAAIRGSLNVIKYLVYWKFIDINVISENVDRLTPLGEAAKAGKVESVKLLLDLEMKNTHDSRFNHSYLHLAAKKGNIEVCKLLLQSFHVDVRNALGQTPAYLAAREGTLDALRFLLENGADPYARAHGNLTLMHAAVISGHADVVRELTRYKELINTPDKWDDLPIDIKMVFPNMEVVKILVDAGSNITDKCIWNNIYFGHIDIVKYLLEKSGKVNIQTTWYKPPNCNRTLLMYLLEQKMPYDMIEFVLKQGADINIRDCMNETVLHTALKSSYKEEDILAVVKLLLDRGADAVVNVRDVKGLTALDYAKLRLFHKVDEYLRKFGATTYPSQHCECSSDCCFHPTCVPRNDKNFEFITLLCESKFTKGVPGGLLHGLISEKREE